MQGEEEIRMVSAVRMRVRVSRIRKRGWSAHGESES